MKTYYLSLKASPEKGNNNYGKIAGAYISFWIVDNSPAAAHKRAEAYLFRECWKILNLEKDVVEISEEQYLESDILLGNYRLAQERGMAIIFDVWLEDANKKEDDIIKH